MRQDPSSESKDAIILRIIDNDKQYKTLNLEYSLKKINIDLLIEAIVNSEHLTELNIGYNQDIESAEFIRILEACKQNKSILTLDLGANHTNEEVVNSITSLIRSNKLINHFNLEGCNDIGNQTIQLIARALSENSTITSFSISGTNISDVSANVLIENLQHNRTIVSLSNPTSDPDPHYEDQDNLSPAINASIRKLIARNNEYSPEQRKFFAEIKDKLITSLRDYHQEGPSASLELPQRTFEVVNSVMNKISDKQIVKEIRDLFLISKNSDQLPNFAKKAFYTIDRGVTEKILQQAIKISVNDSDLKFDEREGQIISEVFYRYFNERKKEAIAPKSYDRLSSERGNNI